VCDVGLAVDVAAAEGLTAGATEVAATLSASGAATSGTAVATTTAAAAPSLSATVNTAVAAAAVINAASGHFSCDANLQDHFARHGGDFGAKTATEYEQQAARFLNGPLQKGVLQTVRPNGDIVRFNPATNEFGVAASNGIIRTYFK